MSRPIAVLISDVHYNLQTLLLADAAMRMAINKANDLYVPLIVAGDLHDTKANLRGECVNAMCSTFSTLKPDLECFVLIGNHDKINEKSEEHSLEFLENYANIINQYRYDADMNLHMLPYYSNADDLRRQLSIIPSGEILVMHQGIQGKNMGDYIVDKSAITMKDIEGLIVHSGHYHTRDEIYIGNPYTLSWGEANDPRKGFKILYDDGNAEFIPTNLRKHVILIMKDGKYLDSSSPGFDVRDLIWVKAQSRMTREEIRDILGIDNFKLTYELPEQKSKVQEVNLTQSEILDNIINDMSNTDEEQETTPNSLEKSMRVKSVYLQNFGSYKELEFNFENQGLTLISGPTGAGKSTLMDAIPWLLFGKTSKGGNVDEICTWNTKGRTFGVISLSDGITIARSRNPNDLFYNNEIRGKDIRDTQALIDKLLGITYETYISGAYFHEFSQTAQFFITNAKNRRQICEQLCDLSLVVSLQDKISSKNKTLVKTQQTVSNTINSIISNISEFERLETMEMQKHDQWNLQRELVIQRTIQLSKQFEKSRITIIKNQCKSCGTVLKEPYESYNDSPNPYSVQLEELKTEVNPHDSGVRNFSKEINEKKRSLMKMNADNKVISKDIEDISLLKSSVDTLRISLISNTISYIEKETNQRLLKHFDGEIQVKFQAEDMDKLDVEIQKDGNACNYSQLSKGQRQLLKLCFGVSVMEAVSNHKGVHFAQIFTDEFADGLDESLKIKTFHLLEELAMKHESVFAIDHSEGLKALFDNKYSVELINGESQIEKN